MKNSPNNRRKSSINLDKNTVAETNAPVSQIVPKNQNLKEKQQISIPQVGYITSKLLWVAGVDMDIIAKCPQSEIYKQSTVGLTVVCTALLASISGGYAISNVFDGYVITIIFAMLWGGFIFVIDRLLVISTTKPVTKELPIAQVGFLAKGKSLLVFSGKLLASTFFIRLIVAILLSIVISKPLEIRLMDTKIVQQIEKNTLEERQNTANLLREKKSIFEVTRQKYYAERKEIENAYITEKPTQLQEAENAILIAKKEFDNQEKRIQANKNSLEKDISFLNYKINEEQKDMRPNPVKIKNWRNEIEQKRIAKSALNNSLLYYQNQIAEKEKLANEIGGQYRSSYNTKIAIIDTSLSQLAIQEQNEIIQISRVQNSENLGTTQLIDKIAALSAASKQNSTIALTSWFLMALFVTLEITPILAKTIMPRSLYDELLEKENERILLEYNIRIDIEKILTENSKKELMQKISEKDTNLQRLKISLEEHTKHNQEILKKDHELLLKKKEQQAMDARAEELDLAFLAQEMSFMERKLEQELELYERRKDLAMKNQQLQDEVTRIHEVNAAHIKKQVEDNTQILAEISRGHLEVVKEQVRVWLAKEKENVKKQFDN